jgi:CO/xanthine dehydrogenase Mo-binding subunit
MVMQLLAEEFDVEPHQVDVVYSETKQGLSGTGPGGSHLI